MTNGAHRAVARRLQDTRSGWIALPAGVVAWELLGRASHFVLLPPFSAALAAVWRMTWSGEIPSNILASLTALVIGYGAAVVVGVPLGVLMGRDRRVEAFLDVYLTLLLATPSILFVPILLGLFGTGRLTQVTFIFLSTLVIITVNARSGIRSVDAAYVDMARSFGATDRQILTRILLPGAVPLIMAGLRMGMARGVRAMINGEMLIVMIGIGALLRRYGGRFDVASVYGLLLVVVGIALVCTSVIQRVERRMTRWMEVP